MRYDSRCTATKFKCAFGATLGAIFFIILILFFQVFAFTEKDLLTYRSLAEANISPDNDEKTLAEQKRRGVCKEIFFMKGPSRLCLKVKSISSTLQLNQMGTETELIEKLGNVVGVMQEELFYRLPDGREALLHESGRLLLRNQEFVDYPLSSTQPMQSLRYFEAETAIYSYKDNRLEAHQVKVLRYILPGHDFRESLQAFQPQMIGFAKEAVLSFEEGAPRFKASQLKAVFYEEK